MSDCPGLLSPRCVNQLESPSADGWPCDTPKPDGSELDCLFCNDPANADDPCALVADMESPLNRCSGEANAPVAYNPSTRPWWRLWFGTDNTNPNGIRYRDFENTTDDFFGRETYRYIVQPDTQLELCPCAPQDYCRHPLDADSYRYCRALIQGRHRDKGGAPKGWSMQCNPVLVDDDQFRSRTLVFGLDPSNYFGHIFIRIVASDLAYCFEGAGHYCFSVGGGCGDYYDCLEDISGGRSTAVDRLLCDVNVSFADDTVRIPDVGTVAFPQSNPWDVHLANAAWYGLCDYRDMGVGLLDQFDDPGHDSSLAHYALSKNTWIHSETFDEDNAGLANMGVEPFPPVVGIERVHVQYPNGLYPESAGQAIPITCRSTVRQEEIDAELTYYQVAVVLQLNVERLLDVDHPEESGKHRVFADIDIFLRLRVRLLPYVRSSLHLKEPRPNRFMRANMLNPDDPYDLRLKDPDNPTQEHPHEKLIAYGPHGERVPRRMRWVGLRSARKYAHVSVGDDPSQANSAFFAFADSGYHAGNETCCGSLHAIHGTTIFGACTDCSEVIVTEESPGGVNEDIEIVGIRPQWYTGAVTLFVPDIANHQIC